MMSIGHQVTRSLPTPWIESRITPGRTHHVALTGKKFQVNRRRHQFEFFEEFSSLLKLLPRLCPRHEYVFVLDRCIRVSGRKHEAVHPKRGQKLEKFPDLLQVCFSEDCCVRAD